MVHRRRSNHLSTHAMSREEMVVRHISKSTVTPYITQQQARCDLTPWDLRLLYLRYTQKGLLFPKSQHQPPSQRQEDQVQLIERLKVSLSQALVYFSPVAGRLKTERHQDGTATVFIDCNSAGAQLIHAAADTSIADILHPIHVPPIVKSLFPLNGALNYEGHSLPLLAVQVTELHDGIFMGFSFNHVLGDGSSLWHFVNSWSQIFSGSGVMTQHVSRPPVLDRWFPNNSLVRLPFSDTELTTIFNPPPLKDRFFHFASESIAQLKSKANDQCNSDQITSFQAVSAHVWRSVTKARALPPGHETSYLFAVNNRSRIQPPFSPDYFGNCVQLIGASTTVGELLEQDLGWAARLIFTAVAAHTDSAIRKDLEEWVKTPSFPRLESFGSSDLTIGSSPRFDMYGNDFGWGTPLAVRSGPTSKFDGKIMIYPGREGGGSMDFELSLSSVTMSMIESDQEFMDAVSKN